VYQPVPAKGIVIDIKRLSSVHSFNHSFNIPRATINPSQDGVQTLGSAMVMRGGLGLKLGLNSRNLPQKRMSPATPFFLVSKSKRSHIIISATDYIVF